jgi:hypothetical protein
VSHRSYTANLTPCGTVSVTIYTIHGQIQPEFELMADGLQITKGYLYEWVADELDNGIDAFDFRCQIENSEPVDDSGFDECANDERRLEGDR